MVYKGFKYVTILALSLQFLHVKSQLSASDYQRADSIQLFSKLVLNNIDESDWVDSTYFFWYKLNTENGDEYFILNAGTQQTRQAFNQDKLSEKINLKFKSNYKPFEIPLRDLKFSKDLKSLEFIIETSRVKYNLETNEIISVKIEETEIPEYWGNSLDLTTNDPVYSPDSTFIAYIKDHNVFCKDISENKEFQLSYGGSEGEYYSAFLFWSPDSRKIATYKVRDTQKKYMLILESTPKEQFLPVLHKREYFRPGDALPIKLPALFDIENKKQIPIETDAYYNQFSLDNIEWDKLSQSFSFEFNQRGHQVYQVVRVDAETGNLTTLINETSNTFIDYSSKRFRYNLKECDKIIWASERDGWNHLYLYNGKSGSLIRQITKGNWLVREVKYVDEANKQIYFAASGKNIGEDPYFIHYYRINFDGKGLTELTREKANHQANFSYDYNYFIDTYSEVNQPPVTVLCESKKGKILATIQEADISKLLAAGYIMPEPFVAKARDGKTDIWGNIYRPTNFDSTKKYPIIEFIYAGPHSSFVQKSFLPYHSAISSLAELGFIVVQIDGMGTSNRSKAFHDVCYKNLKDAGFPDRILWIKAAARKYNYMDTTRVGIFGGSAGGQSSTAAVLFHPEFYKVAVSSCGCHDNRIDKIWWNEQWMGYPVGPHYAENSNIVNAGKLKGKLMLIVGEIDDNVDPASTYQLADALIKANKEFELVLLPGVNHTLGGEHGQRKRRDFFIRHLLNIEPPDWNIE